MAATNHTSLRDGRPVRVMTWPDAVALLESGEAVNLKCWKLKNAEILEYRGVRCVGSHWRGGTHRLKFPESHLIREVRDITIFEINGYEIIR